jgi:hypothetical protein
LTLPFSCLCVVLCCVGFFFFLHHADPHAGNAKRREGKHDERGVVYPSLSTTLPPPFLLLSPLFQRPEVHSLAEHRYGGKAQEEWTGEGVGWGEGGLKNRKVIIKNVTLHLLLSKVLVGDNPSCCGES